MFVPNEPTLQWLETLANKYNELAGQAFATMRDDDAKKFRDAAKALRELKATLPALPKPAGPTVR